MPRKKPCTQGSPHYIYRPLSSLNFESYSWSSSTLITERSLAVALFDIIISLLKATLRLSICFCFACRSSSNFFCRLRFGRGRLILQFLYSFIEHGEENCFKILTPTLAHHSWATSLPQYQGTNVKRVREKVYKKVGKWIFYFDKKKWLSII